MLYGHESSGIRPMRWLLLSSTQPAAAMAVVAVVCRKGVAVVGTTVVEGGCAVASHRCCAGQLHSPELSGPMAGGGQTAGFHAEQLQVGHCRRKVCEDREGCEDEMKFI